MSRQTIFFSYSRKDSDFALDLAKQLRAAGATIWLDQLDIQPGSTWDDAIEDALQNSKVLLVILSKTSVQSKNVRDEYSYAMEEGKRIVPLLLEECTIPFRLRRLQYADFSIHHKTGIQTLIESLDLDLDVASRLTDHKSSSQSKSAVTPVTSSVESNRKNKRIKTPYFVLGSIMMLTLAFWIGQSFLSPENNVSQVTILVHNEAGKDQLILPNRGQVKLIYGDANVVETINSKGEATFKQIPEHFFSEDATVEILFIDP